MCFHLLLKLKRFNISQGVKENIAENTDQNDCAKFLNCIDISEF